MADIDYLKTELVIGSLVKRPMAWDEQVGANSPKIVIIQW